jgi:hypothetical protein
MAKKDQIDSAALEILESKPEGVRFSILVAAIKEKHPDIKIPFLSAVVPGLEQRHPGEIYKPSRGLYRLIKYKETESEEKAELEKPPKKKNEENFYQPFANWLVDELWDCEQAIPLGGNIFGDKWGTPDVIGVRNKPRLTGLMRTPEIVSAEIKTDTRKLIEAFGQACAYQAFSHSVYLVIPEESDEDDRQRLDSLCLIFGIGFVLFDSKNFKSPQFKLRVRASMHEPDILFVERYLKYHLSFYAGVSPCFYPSLKEDMR